MIQYSDDNSSDEQNMFSQVDTSPKKNVINQKTYSNKFTNVSTKRGNHTTKNSSEKSPVKKLNVGLKMRKTAKYSNTAKQSMTDAQEHDDELSRSSSDDEHVTSPSKKIIKIEKESPNNKLNQVTERRSIIATACKNLFNSDDEHNEYAVDFKEKKCVDINDSSRNLAAGSEILGKRKIVHNEDNSSSFEKTRSNAKRQRIISSDEETIDMKYCLKPNDNTAVLKPYQIRKEKMGSSDDEEFPNRICLDSENTDNSERNANNKIAIKKEKIINDTDNIDQTSQDIFNNMERYSPINGRSQEYSSNSASQEMPLSQFWIHQNRSSKKIVDDTLENFSQNSELSDREKIERSPPRITNTEIVNTRYKIINEDEKLGFTIKSDSPRKRRVACISESSSNQSIKVETSTDVDNNQLATCNYSSNDSTSNRNEIYNKIDQSLQSIPSSSKDIQNSKKKMPNSENKQVARKRQSIKSEKLDVGNSDQPKSTQKPIIEKTTVTKPLKFKMDICDDDTTEEESEETGVSREPSYKLNFLSLEESKLSSKKKSNIGSRQLKLVAKPADQISKPFINNNVSDTEYGDSISTVNNTSSSKNKSTMHDSRLNKTSSTKKKLSVQKSFHNKESLTEKPPNLATNRTSNGNTHRHNSSRCSTVESDSSSSSSDESSTPDHQAPVRVVNQKNLINRSKSEISSERSNLTRPSTENSHSISDSEDIDSLTKLNTTINRSMALMESTPELTKPQKSKKLVSINTKPVSLTSNDNLSRRSILKKPNSALTHENNEANDDLQQNSQEEMAPEVSVPRIIKRPLNLQDLVNQENFVNNSAESNFKLEEISSDEEIWLLEVPKMVDPEELKGQIIKLGGKNKLHCGNKLYETCNMDGMNLSCAFNTGSTKIPWKIVNIKPAGFINMRQKLSKKLPIDILPTKTATVPVSFQLKARHPLFGVNYEDKIVTPSIDHVKRIKKSHKTSKLSRENDSRIDQSPRPANITIKSEPQSSSDSDYNDFSEPKLKQRCKNRKMSSTANPIEDFQSQASDMLRSSTSQKTRPKMSKTKHESSITNVKNKTCLSKSMSHKFNETDSKDEVPVAKKPSHRQSMQNTKTIWTMSMFQKRQKKSL